MPTQRGEHYRLIQDQSEIGSKESLADVDGSKSNQKPGVSLSRRLKVLAKTSNWVMLLLIMSAAINVSLAALLITYRFYPTFQAQEVTHIAPSGISPYG